MVQHFLNSNLGFPKTNLSKNDLIGPIEIVTILYTPVNDMSLLQLEGTLHRI